jgi:hypothetical protein
MLYSLVIPLHSQACNISYNIQNVYEQVITSLTETNTSCLATGSDPFDNCLPT